MGAVNDVSHDRGLVAWALDAFGGFVDMLDLGCAGGALVYDFACAGHNSVGVEGSDVALLAGSGFWPFIPDRLFTADITQPFEILQDGRELQFHLITAWEVL